MKAQCGYKLKNFAMYFNNKECHIAKSLLKQTFLIVCKKNQVVCLNLII